MKVPDQVNEDELCEDICHDLTPWATDGVKVNVKVSEDNGFKDLEALDLFLDIWEVIKR